LLSPYLARNLLRNIPLDLYGIYSGPESDPASVNPPNLFIAGFDGILFDDRLTVYEFEFFSFAESVLPGGVAPPAHPVTE
jgi:hypothetical protein